MELGQARDGLNGSGVQLLFRFDVPSGRTRDVPRFLLAAMLQDN